jgi:Beta-glucosidase-related glycosidases
VHPFRTLPGARGATRQCVKPHSRPLEPALADGCRGFATGANYVRGATLFPQQLGLAAAFDTRLLHDGGFTTAKDTRAAGLHWMFSPVLGL